MQHDLLRIEDILTAAKYRSNRTKSFQVDAGFLVAWACQPIIYLQDYCRQHGIVMDWDGLGKQCRDSLPPTHLYKVLLQYLDPVCGPGQFADFQYYYKLGAPFLCLRRF